MNINVTRGNNPGGICRYLLRPDKQKVEDQERSPIIATNMCGRNWTELAEEFRFSHELNSRVKKSIAHYSVSLPPGEQVNPAAIADISSRLLEEMGHNNCQFFVVQHHDREAENNVQHWHIATSTINLDGKWVSDSFDRYRVRHIERQLEQEFGLTRYQIQPEQQRHNLTTGEYRHKQKTGEELPKEKLWRLIDQAASDRPSMSLLVARLRSQGISIQVSNRQGAKGISFGVDGSTFAGRKLGPAYSFPGLQKYLGIRYDRSQDETLNRLNNASSEQCQEVLTQYDLAENLYPIAQQVAETYRANGKEIMSEGVREVETNFYFLQRDESENFSVIAKDGRGELLRVDEDNRVLVAQNLTDEDGTRFQKAQQLLQDMNQKQEGEKLEPNRQKQRSIQRDRGGYEME